MIQVGTAPDPSSTTPNRETEDCLVLNGQLIEDSWASQYFGHFRAEVNDATAVTLLLDCSLAEIADNFDELTLLLPDPPNDDLDSVEVVCREMGSAERLRFDFTYRFEPDDWAKLWSIGDFASTLKKVVEDSGVPGLGYYHGNEEFVSSGISLRVELHAREETVQQALERWLPIIRDVCEEVDARLTANARKGSLVALFRFAPEVKTACEQYLLYFVQFLQDLGIRATADLQEQARGVLFTMTPESGPEALERIREALDLYLRMPQSPDFDAEAARHTDIAVQQYVANVHHLRSQLALAQTILENKNATIEALQAANLSYKQLLGANTQSQGQLAGSSASETQGDETILAGIVTITKYTWKGFQLNLPLIFRELRRRFKGQS